VLAVIGIIGSLTHSAGMASGSRFGSIALFGGELLDPLGVPGIWFPFGIGVSRTQFVYALVIPLLAFLIVRTLCINGSPRIASRLA